MFRKLAVLACLSTALFACARQVKTAPPTVVHRDTYSYMLVGKDEFLVYVLTDADLKKLKEDIHCGICDITPVPGYIYDLHRLTVHIISKAK